MPHVNHLLEASGALLAMCSTWQVLIIPSSSEGLETKAHQDKKGFLGERGSLSIQSLVLLARLSPSI